MNLASAGPLYCIWLGRRANEVGCVRGEMGRKLAWLSVGALLLGVLTGLVQLFFASSPGMTAAMQRLPSRALWMASWELVFSLGGLLIYASCWRMLRNHRWCHAVMAVLSCSNLLYHFPPLMSVMGRLASNPTWSRAEVLDRAALLPLFQRSEVLALSAHFGLASLAVSALTVLWLASQKATGAWEKEAWRKETLPAARWAARSALLVTALQLPVGIVLLITLPQPDRMAMMGDSGVASLAFVGALLMTFVLLQRLATIAWGAVEQRDLRSVCWLAVTLVVLMTAVLQSTRKASRTQEASHATASESPLL